MGFLPDIFEVVGENGLGQRKGRQSEPSEIRADPGVSISL